MGTVKQHGQPGRMRRGHRAGSRALPIIAWAATCTLAFVLLVACDSGQDAMAPEVHSLDSSSEATVADTAGVCGRTPQIRDALRRVTRRSSCSEVTDEDLAKIQSLFLNGVYDSNHDLRVPADSESGLCRLELNSPAEEPVARKTLADQRSTRMAVGDDECDIGRHSDQLVQQSSRFTTSPIPVEQIGRLQSNDFQGLTGLEKLWLISHPSLRELPDHIFDDLVSLRQLTISNTALNRVPNGAFDSVPKLKLLRLSRNRIVEIPSNAFGNVAILESLDLSRNRIAEIPDDAFEDLTSLTSLDLSSNRIAEIPDDAFEDVTSLTSLNLSGNNWIAEIPDRIFDNLADLWYLGLSSNQLTELPDRIFDNLAQLQRLSLSFNQLTELPDRIFDNLADLRILTLLEPD